MKRVKKFLWGKRVEIVMCVLTAFFTVLVLNMCGCTPTKRVSKTETATKSEILQFDSTAQITSEKIDLVMRSVAEFKETISEWLNENIDYTEQHYDSLGRLISNIRQTTNRSAGETVSKTDNTESTVNLTADRLDSLLAVRFAKLKNDLHSKEAIVEKRGLAWWQDLFVWSGVLAWIVATYFCGRYIKRFFLR